MRLIRKKTESTQSGDRIFWPIGAACGLALCLTPDVACAGLTHALFNAQLPAVLLSFGLLSAVIERNK